MNESFSEFLNQIQADSDMIMQAHRLYLSERTDDLTQEEMLLGLHSAVTNNEELEKQLKLLKQDPVALEQMANFYLNQAWQTENQRPSIRAAFRHAKNELPVIETTILAVAVMYGMYLIATGGVIKSTIKRESDGSYEEVVEKEPFAPIVSTIIKLIQKNTDV